MENEDMIREQMEDTRTSLTDKLEKLENKVVHTVKDATGTVADTVEAVKETVTETKEAVAETVEAVKETVEDTVGAVAKTVKGGVKSVKDFLNIPLQTQRHPWLVMGGAVAAGFCAGKLLLPSTPREPSPSAVPQSALRPQIEAPNGGHHNGRRDKRKRQEGGVLQGLVSQFAPELNQLKSLAVAMLMGLVKDMLAKATPEQFKPQLMGIMDKMTAKLKGEEPPQQGEPTETAEAAPSRGHEERQGDGRKQEHRGGNRHRSKFERH